ncbi:MAG: alpha/beta fold hydrolase [Acidobacteriota bacterium]
MPVQSLPTGVDLYYQSYGQGEPLILIPATGFSCEVWLAHQVPELSKSLNVILHDPRGCGRSTHLEGVYSIDQMADDVVALLDHLRIESAHVVGHSMGGRIGLSMALNFPGRVRSLILASSGSGPAARIGAECVPGLPFRLVVELIEMGFEKFIRHEICDSDTYFTREFREGHPERVQSFYEVAWSTHAKLPQYIELCIARSTWEATHRLGNVRVPTLVVVGDRDVVGSNHVAQAEVLAKRIPKAEYRILQGQSHGFFWQDPEETNSWILNWVQCHAR